MMLPWHSVQQQVCCLAAEEVLPGLPSVVCQLEDSVGVDPSNIQYVAKKIGNGYLRLHGLVGYSYITHIAHSVYSSFGGNVEENCTGLSGTILAEVCLQVM